MKQENISHGNLEKCAVCALENCTECPHSFSMPPEQDYINALQAARDVLQEKINPHPLSYADLTDENGNYVWAIVDMQSEGEWLLINTNKGIASSTETRLLLCDYGRTWLAYRGVPKCAEIVRKSKNTIRIQGVDDLCR